MTVLSPYMASLLEQIAERPMPIPDFQHKKQGSAGALYRHGLVRIGFRPSAAVYVTEEGIEALRMYREAPVDRSVARWSAPFAAVIRELTDYTVETPILRRERGMRPRRRKPTRARPAAKVIALSA